MDEMKWLSSENLSEMVEYLRSQNDHRKKVGRRRFRLYCCACARRIWDRLDAPSQGVIEAIEQHFDDLLSKGALNARFRDWVSHYQHCAADQARMIASGVVWSATSDNYPNLMAMQAAWNVVSSRAYQLRCEGQKAGTALEVIEAAVRQCQGEEAVLQTDLLREIFGNPFRPLAKRKWPADIRGLAQACYEDASNYPMLADALEDANESEAAEHCRQPGHVKGCHVVDWILGKS